MNSRLLMQIAVLSVGLLQGCATRQNPDPLEAMNRKFFSFNEALDDAVLKPVATGYKKVAPSPLRTAISNFGSNFKDLWSAVNLFLQGHPGDAATQLMRVSVNSTFGLAGLIDIATPMRLERQTEDFGQTLGVWGVKPGAYIVWPLLGPSTMRDSLDIPGDFYFSARTVIGDAATANTVGAFQVVNARAAVLNATNLLGEVALDKYSFVRAAYLQRRESLIYNGDPPEDDDDADEGEPAPAGKEPQSKAEFLDDFGPDITLAELQGLRASDLVR